ncbi:MAG: 16S rRNA (uracil(1498)-N(3))-methyltransferase [Rhodobacteraceae bacterium]|nr:16S rRNA (uracil(1498)-N(3))-methyltransferase [Paracoccaceae bacterium]
MTRSRPLTRLYSDLPLGVAKTVRLFGSVDHYVRKVLRGRPGEHLLLFNDRDGEWRVRIKVVHTDCIDTLCVERRAFPDKLPDVWLLFAPLKKAPTNYVVEKATELGVSRIQPVSTQYTNTSRVSLRRLRNVAIESTEQCGGISIPQVRPLEPLKSVLEHWPSNRVLFHCDETMLRWSLPDPGLGPTDRKALLVGPEGGFSPEERDLLRSKDFVAPLALGSRILRAETAVAVALAIVHSSVSGKKPARRR